jgi:hypothetical protein
LEQFKNSFSKKHFPLIFLWIDSKNSLWASVMQKIANAEFSSLCVIFLELCLTILALKFCIACTAKSLAGIPGIAIVPAEQTVNFPLILSLRNAAFSKYSAIGLRQVFPEQTNITRFFIPWMRHRLAISHDLANINYWPKISAPKQWQIKK